MAALDDLGGWLEQYVAGKVTAALTPYVGMQADLAAARAQLDAARVQATADLATITALRAQLAGSPPVPPVLPSGGTGADVEIAGWGRPVWVDDFTGDLSRWNIRDGLQLSYDLATVQARNVTIRDGMLVVTTKREAVRGREWTTGYVDTAGRFAQQYGRFEARMKLNTTAGDSAGIWPAFWMRPDGAVSGEFDIVEAWGEPSTTRTDYRPGSGSWSCHEDTNGGKGKASGWLTPAGAPRLSDDWHVFGVEWKPTGFSALLDGRVVGSATVAKYPWIAASFAAPFHLRIQTQVGQPAYWGVPNAATRQPTELLVDWVRAYAYKAA